jgi:hypothetical protein
VTEPLKEEIEEVSRGRAWYTPFAAIGGVGVVVFSVVAVIAAIMLVIYFVSG